ncbi:MAG: ACT domain-containing protein [Firmicutes bacterium]|nr:ACT domain-containing protein [Bacillota bacterium]
MKAIVTVIGKDKTGIIAAVSGCLAELKVNIEDISQTIMQDYFMMLMMVESKAAGVVEIGEKMAALGAKIGVDIRVQHEGIFNAMHRI